MAANVRVKGFQPTVNGFHFTNNSWPHEPDYQVSIGPVNFAIGDANNGLCGGMVYTVKDLFDTGLLPPPDTTNPPDGSPLFNYIVARLTHSFDWDDTNQYLSWIQMSDGDTNFGPINVMRGLAYHEITEEWPQIQADLDNNVVSPLGLVAGQEPPAIGFLTGIQDLKNCHQVLAWGYDLDDNANLNIHIYDPNYIGDDNVISLNIGDPNNNTAVGVSNHGGEFRGFFRTHYQYHDPRQAVTASFIAEVVESPGFMPGGRIPPPDPIPSNSVMNFLALNKIPLDASGSLRSTLGGLGPDTGLRKIIGADKVAAGSASA